MINYLCETPRGHVLLEDSDGAWRPSVELRHALRFGTDQVLKPGLTANQGWEAFDSSVDLLVLRLIMHVIEHNAPELRLVPPLPVSGTCPGIRFPLCASSFCFWSPIMVRAPDPPPCLAVSGRCLCPDHAAETNPYVMLVSVEIPTRAFWDDSFIDKTLLKKFGLIEISKEVAFGDETLGKEDAKDGSAGEDGRDGGRDAGHWAQSCRSRATHERQVERPQRMALSCIRKEPCATRPGAACCSSSRLASLTHPYNNPGSHGSQCLATYS